MSNYDDFSIIGRVQMHLDAITEVRKQMLQAAHDGNNVLYLHLGENLMALEYSLVGETVRLSELVKAA